MVEIYECKHKVKCDFSGCKNVANYSIVKRGLLRHDICLCRECLDEIYDCVAKIRVPKAVESPFKLNKRLKKNEK